MGQVNVIPFPKPKPETLSERDLKELMGNNQDTYKRHKGSIRRK